MRKAGAIVNHELLNWFSDSLTFISSPTGAPCLQDPTASTSYSCLKLRVKGKGEKLEIKP